MEEKEEKISINKEELKNETVETAKKIRETVQNTNIKEETMETKNFIIEMLKNPIKKIAEIANDNTGKFFNTALFLIVAWAIILFISSTARTIGAFGFSRIFTNFVNLLKTVLTPAIGILVYSVIVLILNKKNKKSLITNISTITITQLPLIISSVVSLIKIVDSDLSTITSPFAYVCSMAATVLGYFGLKELLGEKEDNIFIKQYVVIQVIYHIAYIIFGLLGIYI